VSKVDGVKVYGDMVYFDHWLQENTKYKSQEQMRDILLSTGRDEEYEEVYEELLEEFENWAEENNLDPQTV